MKRVSQQGKTLSASQRRHLEVQAKIRAQGVPRLIQASGSFDALRETLNARLFVGPPKPLHCYELSDEAERASYWRMAEQYSRYAHCEQDQTGTISVAEWMAL